ncbi:ABC transporter substrate-binding protein [Moorena sp. SIO3B2]|uniref:ABC transporter substrate-binding protein n=2 Tax=unclassified Moorena TaxID=2683338 RepID=UPI0013CD77C1|nr:ABC transporter substrate-binding protein [Moorena sp. SIO3B2]NEP34944.1 ABC transporter substrate-binding protein [Moorena sp. SIO3B2]
MVNNSYNHPNPYEIGKIIDDPDKFFGRESLFQFIEDNLRQRVKVILLHGQRRIGKSSILAQIPNKVATDQFYFVNFDLQGYIHKPFSHIIYNLAQEICDHLVDDFDLGQDYLTPPSKQELNNDITIFFDNFLPKVFWLLKSKNLVFLLDEFDVLTNQKPRSEERNFFSYLANLIKRHHQLFMIAVVGRNLVDVPIIVRVFGSPPYHEIGFLNKLSAQRLITKPAKDVVTYEPHAVTKIYNLSAGHPYFTQVLCFTLFLRARENQWKIYSRDVELIVKQAIEKAEAGLAGLWESLPIPERVVFLAVAEAQQRAISQHQLLPEHPLSFLEGYGVIQTNPLYQATKRLKDYGFVDDTERRVKVPLVRHWLLQHHSLRQEILKLETLDQDQSDPIYKLANVRYQQGQIQTALVLYQEVLQVNPNHFSALLALAEVYFQANNFRKAVELYRRVYPVKPVQSKEGFLRSLLNYGDQLIEQQAFTKAKKPFQQMLHIDPEDQLAQQKLEHIEAKIAAISKTPINPVHSTPNPTRLGIGKLAAGVAIISLVGVGFYNLSTPCATGEQKVFGITCVATNSSKTNTSQSISRGERSLFPRIDNNQNIDRATEAFQNANYSEAAKFFKEAWQANRNDPELLIYYNNARAHQQRQHPFTIAVVVPIDQDNDGAKETLRGVAQAQDQFNDSYGLNGRFLEIAIANDGNDQAKAKEIAQALVKEKSIVGVIGHESSKASEAALPVYDQAGLAMISSTSTSTDLSSQDINNNVFFRTAPSNQEFAKKLAKHVKTQAGLDKVVIFYDADSVYSKGFKQDFQTHFEQLGGKVVRDIKLNDPDLNITEELTRNLSQDQVKAAMLFPSTHYIDTAVDIAKANAHLNPNPNNRDQQGLKLFGGDTLYTKTILEEAGQEVEGLTMVVPWFREVPQAITFSTAANKRWGGHVNWVTATSFDATQAFIKALFKEADRKLVLQRLQNVNLVPSDTSGFSLEFTPKGERNDSKPVLVEVIKGKLKFVSEQDQEGIEKSP